MNIFSEDTINGQFKVDNSTKSVYLCFETALTHDEGEFVQIFFKDELKLEIVDNKKEIHEKCLFESNMEADRRGFKSDYLLMKKFDSKAMALAWFNNQIKKSKNVAMRMFPSTSFVDADKIDSHIKLFLDTNKRKDEAKVILNKEINSFIKSMKTKYKDNDQLIELLNNNFNKLKVKKH